MGIISIVLVIDLILFLVLIGVCLFYFSKYSRSRDRRESELLVKLEEGLRLEFKASLKVSLDRQRGKVSGDDVAKFLPMMEGWFSKYNSRDLVWVGNVVDYLVFVGKFNKDITEVVFQEVKLKKTPLNPLQKNLRDCIEAKRVRWEVWRFYEDGTLQLEGKRRGRVEKAGFTKELGKEVEGLLASGLTLDEAYENLKGRGVV